MKLSSQEVKPSETEKKRIRRAAPQAGGAYRSRVKAPRDHSPTAMEIRRVKIIRGVTWFLVLAFATTCVAFISGQGGNKTADTKSQKAQQAPADEKKREIEIALEDVKQRPNDPTSHYNLAVHYQNSGAFEKAVPHFEKAIALDKRHTAAMFHLGQIYLAMNKTGDAEKQIVSLLKIDQKDAEANLLLAQIYQADKNSLKAGKAVDDSIRLNPGNTFAYILKAQILTENGETKAAQATLETALEVAQAEKPELVKFIQQNLDKLKKGK
jgi:tetratricopeptide (TPR) repeat protein